MLNLWQQLAGELDTLRHACTRCGRRDWRRGWRNALDAQTRRFGVYGCGEIGGEGRKGRGSDGDGLGEGEGCRCFYAFVLSPACDPYEEDISVALGDAIYAVRHALSLVSQ